MCGSSGIAAGERGAGPSSSGALTVVRLKPIQNRGYSEGSVCHGIAEGAYFAMLYGSSTPEALEAQRLIELRDRWLNPPEWVEWVDEPAPGYPKRPVSRDEEAAKALKKRTLTNLYNARPQWLADAHAALDAAVAGAYGWSANISDDEVLRELLTLNGGDE